MTTHTQLYQKIIRLQKSIICGYISDIINIFIHLI